MHRYVSYCDWCKRQLEEHMDGPPDEPYRPKGWYYLVGGQYLGSTFCSYSCLKAFVI